MNVNMHKSLREGVVGQYPTHDVHAFFGKFWRPRNSGCVLRPAVTLLYSQSCTPPPGFQSSRRGADVHEMLSCVHFCLNHDARRLLPAQSKTMPTSACVRPRAQYLETASDGSTVGCPYIRPPNEGRLLYDEARGISTSKRGFSGSS